MANTHMTLSKGFTLVEMLIVLAIIGTVTAVVVTGQDSFERSVILTNTAYDIALSIREAQSFGFSGKSATNAVTDSGNYAYGISFDMSVPKVNSYTLFADDKPLSPVTTCHKTSVISGSPNQKIGDCFFSSGASGDTVVNTFAINSGVIISKVCVSSNTATNCINANSNSGQFDISFTRPNNMFVLSSKNAIDTTGNTACIKVSRLNSSRYILVRGYGSAFPYEAGTISVSNKPVASYCSN